MRGELSGNNTVFLTSNIFIMVIVKTQEEIDEVLNQVSEALDEGTKFPGQSYEDGIHAFVEWLEGRGSNPMSE